MSTSRATVARPSTSSSRVIVLGRGRGLGSVLRALRGFPAELVAVVLAAEYAGPGSSPTREAVDPAVAELRESLQALTGEATALARAMRRPLTIDRLGTHPLGSLWLHSLASAFGDLATASSWLGAQLGIHGAVLPATLEPLTFTTESGAQVLGPTARRPGAARDRVRSIPSRTAVPAQVTDAINRASLALLAPGPLLGGILVAGSIPDIREALRATSARVVWISNLAPARDGSASEQLAALRRQQVRVDAVLYDPAASMRIDASELREQGIEAIPRRLVGPRPGMHDRGLLRVALTELLSTLPVHA